MVRSLARAQAAAGHLFLRVLWFLTAVQHPRFVVKSVHRLARVLLPPQMKIWAQVRKGPAEGLWIRLNLRTGKDLFDGTRETLVQEALTSHLGPGMVLYDVGANIGLFTMIGARCVGKLGKVFAFEPDPELCQRLKDNVLRNGFSNVEIVQAAVCSTTGSIDFVRANIEDSPDLGLGRIGAPLPGQSAIRVRSVALDDFAQEVALPDVVKCDVEGAELAVLEGARSLLNRQKPILVCETHATGGLEQVRQLLVQTGYTLRWIDGNHLLASH